MMHNHKLILIAKTTSCKTVTAEIFTRLRLIATMLALLTALLSGTSQTTLGRAGHSILDTIDPNFNPVISTQLYGSKKVEIIVPTADGKILVGGWFNSYNGNNFAHGLLRLNADGSLDATFNTALNVNRFSNQIYSVVTQSDGKILVSGEFTLGTETTLQTLVRLNSDGTQDLTFAYNPSGAFTPQVKQILLRPDGKILLGGGTWTTPTGNKGVVRLNPNGTFDYSFDAPATLGVNDIAWQNSKIIVVQSSNSGSEVFRLNEDGSIDSSFALQTSPNSVLRVFIQPNSKIVVSQGNAPRIYRLNENGGQDSTFLNRDSETALAMQSDSKLIVSEGVFNGTTIKRLTADGAPDASFAAFAASSSISYAALQPDGKILLGDENDPVNTTTNNFLRLNADGSRDNSFRSDGGFQFIEPGIVRAIVVQPDEKIIIGGKFDLVNSVLHPKIARLNGDGTIDNSFQINLTGANRFLNIIEIYNLARQPDGKIVVSGSFTFIANRTLQKDLARLNSDGSLDASFNPNVSITAYDPVFDLGTSKVKVLDNGKILVGVTRRSDGFNPVVPLRLNPDGSRDTSFNPALLRSASEVAIYDLFAPPDGKTVVGGRYTVASGGNATRRSFLVRLNLDGSLDASFQTAEETDKTVRSLVLLSNGKILVVKTLSLANGETQGEVVRLNSDGSPDSAFNDGTGANGKINVLLKLQNGDILVGGKFTQFNNQLRGNLAVLNDDGTLGSALVNFDQEVLCLTPDAQGRILVGGAFTVVAAGNNNFNRTYIARLIDTSAQSSTLFDFDGDGLADSAVFNQITGVWSIRSSLNNQITSVQFGLGTDLLAPANYDGDARTDIAVYRPSSGTWYLQQSTAGFAARQWGTAEDKPVPADYDGDGRADVAVWRPSNGVWYISQSSNNQPQIVQFGLPGDVPLVNADFDGDGRADIAVYRPSNGVWYWLASGSQNAFHGVQFGLLGDIPVPADYNGDGKTDVTVFRRTNGTWYHLLSQPDGSSTFSVFQFGLAIDTPVVADYDGDGRADVSVVRFNTWYSQKSTMGFTTYQFGAQIGEKPVEAAFLSGRPGSF